MSIFSIVAGAVKVGKHLNLKKFLSVDPEGRLIHAPASSSSTTQAFSNTSKVEVEHNLGSFPEVMVWKSERGSAFGAGGSGVGGFGLSGGALPDEVINRGVGFVLFYVDANNFTVLFPECQASGYVEWWEV